jgi:acetyl esterase
MKPRNLLLIAALAAALTAPHGTGVALAQPSRRNQVAKPAPDLANEKYGPYERNVLDLWRAQSDRPTPLVVFIHGGAFRAGSKEMLSAPLLKGLLARGISVMAINYRLSPGVHFPTHYLDCARAIQFARLHAKEWNIDPKRIGATGGSAGAGTSLWIGFHDDLADPNSADPVLRQSTRLACLAVFGAQSTYDPRVIKDWIGEAPARHPAFEGFYGLTTNEMDTPKAYKLYEAASAINYLTADDPPVFLYYDESDAPLPPGAPAGAGIHHPIFGRKLKEKMDALHLECVLKHRNDYPRGPGNVNQDVVDFFVKHLQPGKTKPQS